MSSCSGSDRRRSRARPLRRIRAAALALILGGLSIVAPALAARSVQRVHVSDEGIRVGEGDSLGEGDALPFRAATSDDSLAGDIGIHVGGGRIEVDDNRAGIVRVFADAEVPAGDRIEGDVVAVFGSVDVAGTVSGNVVAVFGSVRLQPGAAIDGDVVAVGGALDQAEGATVSGQSVALGFFPIPWGLPALPILLLAVVLGWLLSLAGGWMVDMIFPDRLRRIAVTASRHTAGSFFLGVVSVPLLVVAVALLFITVVGIPFAFLLPLVYVVIVWVGQIAASLLLGWRLLRRAPGEGSAVSAIAAGNLFVAGFLVIGALLSGPPGLARSGGLFFTLLGGLLVVTLSTIGTGAFLLSRAGNRPASLPAPASGGPASQPAAPPLSSPTPSV